MRDIPSFIWTFRLQTVFIVILAFSVVSTAILIKLYKKNKSKLTFLHRLLLIFTPSSQIMLLTWSTDIHTGQSLAMKITLLSLAAVISLAADCVIVLLLYPGARNKSLQEKLDNIEKQRVLEREYINLMEFHLAETADMRHEARNQLQIARSLLSSPEVEDKQAAVELLDFFSQSNESSDFIKYCDNSVVNAILTVKKSVALNNGINFEISAALPEKLKIEKIDLCSVFCNLIDNAIEACTGIENNGPQKHIGIKTKVISGYLVLKINNNKQNPVAVDEDGVILTGKKTDGHGLGLQIVDKIVRKYDGDILVDYNTESFTVTLKMKVL